MDDLKNLNQLTDEDLVKEALTSQSAFAVLLKRYQAKLTRYIIRISGVRFEDAEDIVQEVFLKAYLNLNDFDLDYKFSSWIYRIAHNEAISHYRKTQTRPQFLNLDVGEEHLDFLVSELDITKSTDRNFLINSLNAVFLELDEKYREVLVLKFIEDYDYQEISNILKKPMGTVATLINRAKAQFKKRAQELKINFK